MDEFWSDMADAISELGDALAASSIEPVQVRHLARFLSTIAPGDKIVIEIDTAGAIRLTHNGMELPY